MKKKESLSPIALILLVLFGIVCFLPFLWVLVSAVKPANEIMIKPFALPSRIMLSNFSSAWEQASIGSFFWNSLIISGISVGLILIVSAMSAYILGRVAPSLFLFTYFTMGIMIPLQAIVIPTFVIIKNMGLLNTRAGLILAYTTSGLSFGIFVLTAFFRTIPGEMEEAAVIDGCSRGRIFTSILLPLAKPGLATVGTFVFLQCWNEYLFASVLIAKPQFKTLTQGIMLLKGQYSTNYAVLCAGLTFAILPVLAAFIVLQKQVIRGLMAGAVKG